VRRWILAGCSIEEPVSTVTTTDPLVLRPGESAAQARDVIAENQIDILPVVDETGRVVSVVRWMDFFGVPRRKHGTITAPVVIMAGGVGSRLAPFTDVLPKPLVPVGGKPIVERIMERFADSGCREFYLSVGYKAGLIRAYFADAEHDYDLEFVQEEQALGTAGSLSLLRGRLAVPFFVSNCDILVDADYADLYKFHTESGNRISIVASMKEFTVPYGVCEIAAGGALTRMIEKPEYNFFVSTGLYVLAPDVLEDIRDGEHLHITDLLNRYVEGGERVGVYPVSERAWMDMGQWDEFRRMSEGLGV
jgi:NDP-sugar pyrophosphorylase family protein